MATSAHSTANPPAPQVSNCADLTLYRYRARLEEGDVYGEVCLVPYLGKTWRTERYMGRPGQTKGKMGARQRERAQ
ncbi:MAG TPA: hypothetical protein VFS21_35995, partial [Roseiflexaceae bacterium]|nr:hypothetical protein [Roseiflexaceae bacterium]